MAIRKNLFIGTSKKLQPTNTTIRRQALQRRGVLLLLILALLSMFGMIAIAFVLMSSQSQRGARSIERIDRTVSPSKDAESLLKQAALQVLRGPKASQELSAIGPHSLLEDVYGNEYVTGTITGSSKTCGNQLLNLTIGTITTNGTTTNGTITNVPAILSTLKKHIGSVLTITGHTNSSFSSFVGQSTRIVGVTTTNPASIQVVMFSDISGTTPNAFAGATCTINSAPFMGTGFGYNPNTGKMDLCYDISSGSLTSGTDSYPNAKLTALLPNIPLSLYSLDHGSCTFQGVLNVRSNPPGGANEDYDAADFQNMLLAAQVWNSTKNRFDTIPSLHRPALLRYWANKLGGTLSPEFMKLIMLRPLGGPVTSFPWTSSNGNTTTTTISGALPHPDFNGSNPYFNPFWDGITDGEGQWDVDNDGDGVADSVWVDLGMPVRAAPNGQLYKPLFAILCVDLDGRLNVNAHGCTSGTASVSAPEGHLFASSSGGTETANLPCGLGYGPAEISSPTILAQNILTSRYQTGFIGGTASYYMGLNKWFLYGHGNYWSWISSGSVNQTGAYGTPPDVTGAGAIGIDTGGRPIYYNMGQPLGGTNTLQQCPYSINLSAPNRGTGDHTLFGVNELERLLRPYDRDVNILPDRLYNLGGSVTNPITRGAITTDSWDIPTAAAALLVNGTSAHGHISEVLIKLLKERLSLSDEAKALELLPPELLAGRKMDLNRPFGNAIDDDNNNIIDEPGEPYNNNNNNKLTLYTSGTGSTSSGSISYTPLGNITPVDNSLAARQLYARYLYVLAQLLVNKDALKNSAQFQAASARYPSSDDTDEKKIARFLAQWAVNVVDFYDRDSIMTPFEYCVDFSNGWTANVDLPSGTTTNIVWGCERPELLITETLAFHDRRTQDTNEDPTGKKTTDSENPDNDFDQKYKPEGSLFVELYNPQSDLEPCPAELYTGINGNTLSINGGTAGVDLTKKTPLDSENKQYPVWRLAIVATSQIIDGSQIDPQKSDPDNPDHQQAVQPWRIAYFTSDGSLTSGSSTTVIFKPGDTYASKIAPIKPGRYAVIGSGTTTYLGFKEGHNPNSPDSTERRIVLNPDSNPDTQNQVQVFNDGSKNDGSNDDLSGIAAKNPPTAIIIDSVTSGGSISSRRFSISEPDGGYPDISSVVDTPFDFDDNIAISDQVIRDAIRVNGRTDCVAVVHLQRLANPLLPYNKDSNPYRTIDSAPVDLYAFNGIDSTPEKKDGQTLTEQHPDQFDTRERGTQAKQNNLQNDLWLQEISPTGGTTTGSTVTSETLPGFVFKYRLNHTLSYLNSTYGQPLSALGDPQTAFPWFTWNNRPFISGMELALVPPFSSSQLLAMPSFGGSNTYDQTGKFPRLFNILSGSTTNNNEDIGLYKILDFVGVPSRFVGTDIQIDPYVASHNNEEHPFHTPFNRIPLYREPGKINLNTIYSSEVLAALTGTTTNPSWDDFIPSRRGYNTNNTNPILSCNEAYPTNFARPFRSSVAANLVPEIDDPNPLKYASPIDATTLRKNGDNPLFQFSSTGEYNDPDRNPFFFYQGMQRLQNLTTTRSNVYALWITVGYFEVYPDGYTLGRELGKDTGEVKRHRAFFIIDRSIPVGFQRGEDLNVENTILLQKFIE